MKEDIKKLFALARNAVKSAGCIILDNLDDRDFARLSKEVRQREKENAAQVAAWIWLNALVLHAEMAASGHGSLKFPWKEDAKSLLAAWRSMLQRNPNLIVFQDALNAAQCLKRREALSKPLSELQISAEELWKMRAHQPAAVCAQLFPEFASGRKDTAAYYTIPSIAELLAGLAVSQLPNSGGFWKIADFACGTGTLLKAAYRGIVRRANPQGTENVRKFHQKYMEACVFGADIQPTAVDLAITGLAAMFPQIPFGKASIVHAPLSNDRAGSLELLISGQFNQSLDLVIMNPPYSIRKGGVGKLSEFEKQYKKRAGELFEKGNIPGSKRGDLALYYAALADQKLKPGGVFAFILPATAGMSVYWEEFRRHMEENYENLVVVSADESSSESTKIHEIMICGTKRTTPRQTPNPILFVTLKRRPEDLAEARSLSQAIRSIEEKARQEACPPSGSVRTGSDIAGSYFVSPQSDGSKWPVSIHNGAICEIFHRISSGNILANPRIAKPFDQHQHISIGPGGSSIGHVEEGETKSGAFCLREGAPEDGACFFLWKADCENQKFLYCTPTHTGDVIDGQEAKAEKIKDTQATLFIAVDLRLTSQALASAMTKVECLGGGAWTPVICDEEVAPAYWLWFNSIFGLIVRWGLADRSQPGRARTKRNAVKQLPAPDFSENTAEAANMRQIANEFIAGFAKKELMPCAMAWRDPVRQEIDDAVVEMLGLNMSPEKLRHWREMWCKEASVRGDKQEIAELLKKDGLLPK